MLFVTESNVVQRKKMIRYPRDVCFARCLFWSIKLDSDASSFPKQTDKRVNKCAPDFDEPDIETLLLSNRWNERDRIFRAFLVANAN